MIFVKKAINQIFSTFKAMKKLSNFCFTLEMKIFDFNLFMYIPNLLLLYYINF